VGKNCAFGPVAWPLKRLALRLASRGDMGSPSLSRVGIIAFLVSQEAVPAVVNLFLR
jgi:hypothetical protein